MDLSRVMKNPAIIDGFPSGFRNEQKIGNFPASYLPECGNVKLPADYAIVNLIAI